jgi:DNA-binding winged helix-turn-helix (wHTH) protein/Tol biopolymer transport system component
VVVQFGEFAVDVDRRQVFRGGTEVRLGPKAFDLLELLIRNRPRALSKAQIRDQLWPRTFVSDSNLTGLVNELRAALGDEARRPLFIRTVYGFGYSFRGEASEGSEQSGSDPETSAVSRGFLLGLGLTATAHSRSRLVKVVGSVGAIAVISLATVGIVLRGPAKSEPVSFKRVTFRRGVIQHAKFAPDGRTVVYGAAWDGHSSEIYSAVPEGTESRPLGLPESDVLSIAPSGEMAVWLGRALNGRPAGTLARVPSAGGAPREISESVVDAAWAPDGTTLAIVHRAQGKDRIEMPPSNVLYESPGKILSIAISPKADRIAFIEWPGDGASLEVLDLSKAKTTLWRFRGLPGLGLCWSRTGEEVWFTEHGSYASAGHTGPGPADVSAVTLEGKRRVLVRLTGPATLNDRSSDGRVLVTVGDWHGNLVVGPPGETRERDLSWLDQTSEALLSPDGRTVVFNDREGIYRRGTDGSPAVRVGEGLLLPLSPDGKSMLSLQGQASSPAQLSLLPTGAGEPRRIPTGGLLIRFADWLPDGKSILLVAGEPGHRPRIFVQSLDGEGRRALTPEGFSIGFNSVSPDGSLAVARNGDRQLWRVPIRGGDARPLSGAEESESPVGWNKDGRLLYVARTDELPAPIHSIDLSTGRRQLVKEIRPLDPAGFGGFCSISYSGNRFCYAYSYRRYLCTLYVIQGLS